MSRIPYYVAVIVAVITYVVCADGPTTYVTPAEQCEGLEIEDLRERVEIKPCGKRRCKFRKGTSGSIKLRFKPSHKIEDLTLDVYGILSGVHLPFVGVTGSSVCQQIVKADSGEPAPCPLAPDVEYNYTGSFPVASYYPSLSVRVHWGMKDEKGDDVICFEAPIEIK